MKRHWSYLKYVLRHKWFVLVASIRIGAPIWRAIVHDMSKFLPAEWAPYARTFYKPDGSKQYDETPEFNRAWLLHQRRNPHHWQFWLLRMDSGDTIAIQMTKKYVLEMVADWMGAGRAISGTSAQPDKWAIDYTTGRPILTYEGCSVIQDEQAHWLLALIREQSTTAQDNIRRMQESMSMGQVREE